MSYILLHINEFNYLLFSGVLRSYDGRLVDLPSDSDATEIFRAAGYVKYSSPESYMLCSIDRTKVNMIAGDLGTTGARFEIDNIEKFIPLTRHAEILLRPVIQRAQLSIFAPIFEADWHKFVDEEILRERQAAATAFVSLFGCKQLERDHWRPDPNLYPFMIKDLGSGLNEIERRFESAELGTFEFCVRLAHEHDADWRRNDRAYTNLKQVREAELKGKMLVTQSFLKSPRVCCALRDFEEESRAKFGYSPFSLIPFFEFYRTHSRANGINFKQVRETIELLLSNDRKDDASDYAHLVGYALGLEEVTPAQYFIQRDRFPMFSQASSSYPKREELLVTPPSAIAYLFAIPQDIPPTVPNLNIDPSVTKEPLGVNEADPVGTDSSVPADISAVDTGTPAREELNAAAKGAVDPTSSAAVATGPDEESPNVGLDARSQALASPEVSDVAKSACIEPDTNEVGKEQKDVDPCALTANASDTQLTFLEPAGDSVAALESPKPRRKRSSASKTLPPKPRKKKEKQDVDLSV